MPTQGITPIYVPPLFQGVGAGAKVFEVKAASWTATKADSGKIFLVYGGTAAVTVTLPKISDGPFMFEVFNCQDQSLTITAETADTMITYNDLAADSFAFSTSSEKIGAGVRVMCDGTKLLVVPILASIYQTTTIAT